MNTIYTRTKISRESALALFHKVKFNKQNMCCSGEELFLHGNKIAWLENDNGKTVLKISDCGWQTNTTKERLNAVLQAFGLNVGIWQKKGVWFIGNGDYTSKSGNEFNGQASFILI